MKFAGLEIKKKSLHKATDEQVYNAVGLRDIRLVFGPWLAGNTLLLILRFSCGFPVALERYRNLSLTSSELK